MKRINSSKKINKKYSNPFKRPEYFSTRFLRSFLKVYFVLAAFIFNLFYFSNEVDIKFSKDSYLGNQWAQALNNKKLIILFFNTDAVEQNRDYAQIIDNLAYKFRLKYDYIKVNEADLENNKLISAFRVKRYPSTFLVDPSSGLIKKIPLYVEHNKLKQELRIFMREALRPQK